MAQTLEQFGQTIKAKYPQYNDIPDVELGQKMLAKYPQYQDMVSSIEHGPAKIQQLQKEAESAQRANIPLLQRFSQEFNPIKTTGKVLKEGAQQVMNVPRFAASTAILPYDISQQVQGKNPYEGNIPLLGQTFQGEASQKQREIIEGKRPLYHALQPFAEVPLAGLETLGAIKTGQKAIEAARKTGGILTNALKARKETKVIKDAIDIVSPKMTQREVEEAFKAGRLGKQGVVSGAETMADPLQKRMVDAVTPLIQQGRVKGGSNPNTLINNAKEISQEVQKINVGAKEMVANHPSILNMNQLRSKLNAAKDNLRLVFASDPTVERTYNAVADEFISHVKLGNNISVFEARQAFDKVPAIKKLLETEAKGENTRRSIVLAIRDAANQYVADTLPTNNPFRAALKTETYLLRTIENMATKIKPTITQTGKIGSFIGRHPTIKNVVKYGLPSGIIGGEITRRLMSK